jgi:predicted dehydrogenase
MKNFNRREFLKTSFLGAAALSSLPAWAATKAAGSPNEELRYAVVGFGGRGQNHIDELRNIRGTWLVALCDADENILRKGIQNCEAKGQKVEGYSDFRKLLEKKDLDFVTFATPNHWHSLNIVWSVQAGKDVYVEKPISHNVWEGRQAVLAARKYKRIVQAGTQCRSSQGLQEAIAWLREGHIGRILRARGLCYKRRASIGKVDGPQPIPPGVDYDLWCGPAPKEPLMRKRLHYDWHWVWPTGNGDLGNQGIHQMDIGRWVLGEDALSPSVWSIGGRLGYVDDATTPNTQIVFHDYKRAPLIFEVRGLPESDTSKEMDNYRGASIGVVVDCDGGYLVIPSYTSANFFDKDNKPVKSFKGGSSHFENFIKAVRSRNIKDLNADVLEGHLSSALCHTGNISYLLGDKQSPEEIHEAVRLSKDMAEAFGRMEQHLGANKVDLSKTPVTVGAFLKMDPKTERFIGNKRANELLTRDYRKPFVVPKKV